jgi:hypothetical protein
MEARAGLGAAFAIALLLASTGIARAEMIETTIGPVGDDFTVALQTGTNATFTIPTVATVGCSSASTTGTVPARNSNADGPISIFTDAALALGTCPAPTGWTYAAGGQPTANTRFAMVFRRALIGTLTGSFGTVPNNVRMVMRRTGETTNCTVTMPHESAIMVGSWVNGTGGTDSIMTLAIELNYRATNEGTSPSCIAGVTTPQTLRGTFTGVWRIHDTSNAAASIRVT